MTELMDYISALPMFQEDRADFLYGKPKKKHTKKHHKKASKKNDNIDREVKPFKDGITIKSHQKVCISGIDHRSSTTYNFKKLYKRFKSKYYVAVINECNIATDDNIMTTRRKRFCVNTQSIKRPVDTVVIPVDRSKAFEPFKYLSRYSSVRKVTKHSNLEYLYHKLEKRWKKILNNNKKKTVIMVIPKVITTTPNKYSPTLKEIDIILVSPPKKKYVTKNARKYKLMILKDAIDVTKIVYPKMQPSVIYVEPGACGALDSYKKDKKRIQLQLIM